MTPTITTIATATVRTTTLSAALEFLSTLAIADFCDRPIPVKVTTKMEQKKHGREKHHRNQK